MQKERIRDRDIKLSLSTILIIVLMLIIDFYYDCLDDFAQILLSLK